MVNRSVPRAGKVRLGCLVGILIVAAGIYFAWNISMPALHFYEYQDAMEQEARFAAHNPNETILVHLRAKADSLDLPESAKKIQIRRKGNQIWIWADYTEQIELPGFVKEVDLKPHAERVF
jgi:hypothetical protein